MAKCIDCLHFEVCKHKMEEICKFTKIEDLIHNCSKFTDRTKYVEVVRCKDCKHYWLPQGFCTHDRHDHQTSAVWQEDDDFCSYGERREGE